MNAISRSQFDMAAPAANREDAKTTENIFWGGALLVSGVSIQNKTIHTGKVGEGSPGLHDSQSAHERKASLVAFHGAAAP